MSTEVIAALWGALAGGVSFAAIESVKWFAGRRRRKKAIQIALCYEVFRHLVYEVSRSPEGEPNFRLVSFARESYDAYLVEIPDLLPEKLVGDLSIYYANLTMAYHQQQRIEEDTTRARTVTRELVHLESSHTSTHPVHPDEVRAVKDEGRQTADRLGDMIFQSRFLLAAAMAQREQLLSTLGRVLRHDPAKDPVEVLPQHREWFDRTTRRLGDGRVEPGPKDSDGKKA